ncbi:hypothetical protein EOD41_14565 [Mucilaginibacter limnophilus]|uniref:Uncharacterized protein n=1 Tax=Mucilaginibacter limnophilus TaxID=1932778 RepID=A0A3S2VLP5_9SPHI|nr:hypothetical protein [Mucilaginibacter limnophilus]RVU00180.1 hypothetical protein EOD41_14565 [Mucilaginibacter limnophilus]
MEFELKGDNALLKVEIQDVYGYPNVTSHFGGYDARLSVKINIDGFQVLGDIYSSTGEIYKLYQQLFACNISLKGSVHFENYEHNLEFNAVYGINGKVKVNGEFEKHDEFRNVLQFEFETDQSYISSTLLQLKRIVEKYGDNKGVIKE